MLNEMTCVQHWNEAWHIADLINVLFSQLLALVLKDSSPSLPAWLLSTVLIKGCSLSHSLSPHWLPILHLCDILRSWGPRRECTVLSQFSLKPVSPGLNYNCRMKAIVPMSGSSVSPFPPVYFIDCPLFDPRTPA